MNVEFAHFERIGWAWVIPVALVCATIGVARRRGWMRGFASARLLPRITQPVGAARQYGRLVLLGASMVLVLIALMDPRWGEKYEEVEQRGIDIVAVLDVSRSMLAQDARPDRLTRAKQIARDLADELRGDRVALVTAAGSAAITCPLTVDRGAFRMALDLADPQTATRGGSLLGDALRVASTAFVDEIPDHKAIVLISDGEDHDSYPVEAATDIFTSRGIRVFTVGIGDPETGARVPIVENGRRRFLQYEGADVVTKLEESMLRDMAVAGGGAYVPVGTRTLDAGRLYREHIEPMTARTFDRAERVTRAVQFHWFAATALGLLVLETLIGMPKGRRNWRPGGLTPPAAALLMALAPAVCTGAARAEDDLSPRAHLRAANTALAAGDDAAAAEHYRAAESAFPELAGVPYNRGVALYRLGRYREAAEAFARAHRLAPSPASKARSAYNLGTATHAEAIESARQATAPTGTDPAQMAEEQQAQQQRVQDAVDRLGEAIDYYRRALDEDPADEDARVNAELADRLMRELQQVPQDESAGDEQNQDEPSPDEQNPDEQNPDQQNQSPGSGEQNENTDPTPQDQDEPQSQDKPQPQPDQEQPQQQQDQPQPSQEPPDEQPPPPEQPEPDQPQPPPQPSGAEQSETPNPDEQTGPPPQPSMSPEEAERLLQRVRDRDRQRQEDRARSERARHTAPERDW